MELGRHPKIRRKGRYNAPRRSKYPQPRARTNNNDDVAIEHFQRSLRHYYEKQRKCVVDERLECRSLTQHVDEDVEAPFFLSPDTLLPSSTRDAAIFLPDSPPIAIIESWATQLNRLGDINPQSTGMGNRRMGLIPTDLIPSSRNINRATLAKLANSRGLGGKIWLLQFLSGFKIIGRLSQTGRYPI